MTDSKKRNELLESLKLYAEREKRVQWRDYFSSRDGSEEEKQAASNVISLANYEQSEGGVHEYSFSDENIRFSPEDELLLFDPVSQKELAEGEVTEIDTFKKRIKLTIKKGSRPTEVSIVAMPIRSRGENPITVALSKICTEPESYPLVMSILDRKVDESNSRLSSSDIKKVIPEIDPITEEIILRASALNNSFLVVQGPPGTGKTASGSQLAAVLCTFGYSVGVMAQAHRVINHFLTKTFEVAEKAGNPISGTKYAFKSRDFIKVKGLSRVSSKVDLINSTDDGHIVGGTVNQFSSFPRPKLDYLICEEAGQLSLAYVLAATMSAKNIILLGDHKQLAQVSQACHPDGAEQSVLEYLLEGRNVVPKKLGVFLKESYRLNEEMADYISQLCYDGELRANAKSSKNNLVISKDPDDPLGPCSIVFKEVSHQGNSVSSEEEAKEVAELVHRLEKSISKEEVLIVTPYRAQENMIRAHLGPDYRIGTVDRFQGQEADVVIFSLCNSDPDNIVRDIDFLLSTNRLNVALSRARKKAILICSPVLLGINTESVEKMKLANKLCFTKHYAERLKEKYR